MQLRLPLLGAFVITAATAIVAACGEDGKAVTVRVLVEAAAPDASSDAESAGDATASPSCEPGTPAAFTFKPAVRYQNKCDDAAIAAILQDCVFGSDIATTCAATKTANADCYACLVGTPQDAVAHPLFVYGPDGGPIASTGVCMATYANDGTAATDCSYAFGQTETCTYEACVSECGDAAESVFETCLAAAAVEPACTTDQAVLTSQTCQDAYNGTKYGFCLDDDLPDGGKLSNGDYYTLLSQLVCGAPPSDADAGADAGDASADAGDAGDAGDGG